ncbi:hypothetical protein K461DRAFT_310371 [Myriangium duriaei CBS 260.36]|uniref:Ketoreductase (KR) domain-containing protein n=1 Tax=Myriangium duriaei CBS 260.36 TaxID=1168546 RepID=A0A9P4J621_9PEZI|nr:hypothetical protein K461DRAFT_310371 [Myriangium duriaei CBS 260.36]
MVSLSSVEAAVSSLVASRPLVAVFVGGTSGIGQNTVRQLAAVHGKTGPGLRAYIVGRNKNAAAETIAICQRECPKGQFIFVEASDLALIQDVDKTCSEIIRLENEAARGDKGQAPHIDMLYISSGQFIWEKRTETREGIDRTMSLIYYSRMRCVVNLLPLLTASTTPAHVVTIFGPGLEADFHGDDLSLREAKNQGIVNMRSHVVHMTTLFGEALVKQHPGKLSFCHSYPGFVFTTLWEGRQLPWWFRAIFRWLAPLWKLLAFTGEENGERMLYMSTPHFPASNSSGKNDLSAELPMGSDGTRGSGAYAVLQKGETMPAAKMDKKYAHLRANGMVRKVFDHTMSAFEEATAGRRFTG